jgi:hypothetical protein
MKIDASIACIGISAYLNLKGLLRRTSMTLQLITGLFSCRRHWASATFAAPCDLTTAIGTHILTAL